MDPASVANGLAVNPLAWMLAITLAVVGYLYKQLSDERVRHAKELGEAKDALIASIRADAKEQREILSQVVPLAAKLVEGLEILEDLTRDER